MSDLVSQIEQKNNTVLKSLAGSASSASTKAISDIEQLKTILEGFKDTLLEYQELAKEKAMIISKYSKQGASGSYNLPGVFSSSVGHTDVTLMKADNARIGEIGPVIERLKDQKDSYQKMLTRYVNELIYQIRLLTRSSDDIESYLAQLEQATNWN